MPHPTQEPSVTLELSRDMADLVGMRHWLTGALGPALARRPGAIDDVVVMANELVANVVMHTRSTPRIAVATEVDRVRVAVHDDHPSVPVLEPADPHRPRGNGLRIVDAWSTEWGAEADPAGGKWVWFAVPT